MKNLKIITLTIAIAINLLVLINNILHDPGIGYDAQNHLDYVYVLPYRLPTPEDTNEYFSAPLPYFIPSIANLIGREYLGISDTEDLNGRTGQFVNLLLSIGITILVLKICEQIAPGNDYYKITSLFFLAILPVYYKTFAQVRGEPYVVFFTFVVIYQSIAYFKNPKPNILKEGIYLGISLGLAILSRQWGFFIFPALAVMTLPLLFNEKSLGQGHVKLTIISVITAFLVGGWFYIQLMKNFGTATAFNREERSFSFSNQPLGFYRNTGLRDLLLFKSPTRSIFDNQLIPVFYSEIWGDYWGFFVFIKEKVPSYGIYANQKEINPYLGRVNFVSLFPTFLYAAGLWISVKMTMDGIKNKRFSLHDLAIIFIISIIFSSAIGYSWFLIKYPEIPRGTTIKATYMLHALALFPFLASELMEKIRSKDMKRYYLVLSICGIILIHNLPAMITRYWFFLK